MLPTGSDELVGDEVLRSSSALYIQIYILNDVDSVIGLGGLNTDKERVYEYNIYYEKVEWFVVFKRIAPVSYLFHNI